MQYSLATIFFSKDRAMQLHASIASCKKRALFYEWADVFVLYKTEKYQYQYDQLAAEFSEVSFIRETNLVKQIQNILLKYDAVLFVVDDTLFYKNFNLGQCVYHLFAQTKALGFSLRLGWNVNWSHIKNGHIEQPELRKIVDNYYYFDWPGKDRDFGYPLEVSSSIYRTKNILPLLEGINGDPGTIEGHFSSKKCLFTKSHPRLICFDYSVAFAIPVNIVRDKTSCPAGREHFYSVEKLTLLFDAGKRIDTFSFPESINGCHQEMEYKFIS